MRCVIDTNIWIHACENTSNYSFNCDSFIISFLNSSHFLMLDYDGKILDEYNNKLRSNEKFQQLYHRLAYQTHRVGYCNSKLSSNHSQELDKLKFHEMADRIFTGVSFNSDKVIITEDSDYGKGENPKAQEQEKQAVLKYMIEMMGMSVMDSQEGNTWLEHSS